MYSCSSLLLMICSGVGTPGSCERSWTISRCTKVFRAGSDLESLVQALEQALLSGRSLRSSQGVKR